MPKALLEYFSPENIVLSPWCLLLGLIPVLIWLAIFTLIIKFRFKTELSLEKILIFFNVGVLIAPFAYFLEDYYSNLTGLNPSQNLTTLQNLIFYLGIATIEELSKFLAVFLISKKGKFSNEPIDAMLYLIVLALGLSLVENFSLATQFLANPQWSLIVIIHKLSLRFISANLLQALSSGIIGYFWVLKNLKRKRKYLFYGLFLGISIHWLSNFVIKLTGGKAAFLVSSVLIALLILFCISVKKLLISLQKYPAKTH
jgi:RsiW-degrading membrane proteinase PrsW (M82 family)